MTELLPAPPMLAAFFAASLVLAVTPGPGVVYIVTRSLREGRAAGLASVVGVAFGNLGNAVAASLGLAAVLAVSAAAFAILKWAGALYLIYLGLRTLCGGPRAGVRRGAARARSRVFILRDGFVVALLNPKTALFFAAFLPQFVGTDSAPLANVVLGALFVLVAAATDTLYAIAAGTVAPRLGAASPLERFSRYAAGGAFLGLGMLAARQR